MHVPMAAPSISARGTQPTDIFDEFVFIDITVTKFNSH